MVCAESKSKAAKIRFWMSCVLLKNLASNLFVPHTCFSILHTHLQARRAAAALAGNLIDLTGDDDAKVGRGGVEGGWCTGQARGGVAHSLPLYLTLACSVCHDKRTRAEKSSNQLPIHCSRCSQPNPLKSPPTPPHPIPP